MIDITAIRIGMQVEIAPWPRGQLEHPRALSKHRYGVKQILEHFAVQDGRYFVGVPMGPEWEEWQPQIPLVAVATIDPCEPDQLLAYLWSGGRKRCRGWYTGPEETDLVLKL